MQIVPSAASLFAMQAMHIQLISVRPVGNHVVARARANAPAIAARVWIEVTFEPTGNDPWVEAYNHMLSLLDIA